MKLEALSMRPLAIPLRTAFAHAAAQRSTTESVWVEAHGGAGVGLGEGCPRPYVTGEDVPSALAFFERHQGALRREIRELADLRAYAAAHAADIDANPAAWCAIELALLDALAREQGVPVERLLDLREASGEFQYTAVIGIGAQALIERYLAFGLRDFKLKLCGELARDRASVQALVSRAPAGVRLRLDANNLWRKRAHAAAYLRALEAPAHAIEEPLAPCAYAELARLGEESGLAVILDESCTRAAQLCGLEPPAERWIANLRVSKLGGLLRSLEVLAAARERGIPWIVGAQVGETSLLTRAALALAAQGRDALRGQEGAFGTLLLAEDPCDPSLRFGAGGVLRTEVTARPGWGLARAAVSARP